MSAGGVAILVFLATWSLARSSLVRSFSGKLKKEGSGGPAGWLRMRPVILPLAALLSGWGMGLTAALALGLAAGTVAAQQGLVRLRVLRERQAREAELERGVLALVGGLRAGLTVPLALEQAARQVSGPLRSDLERILTEYRLGISLSGALAGWKSRAKSPDVDFLVGALEVMRQVAGTTTEPLTQVALALGKRRRLRQEAWSRLAEARLSALAVAGVPPVVALVMGWGRSEAWELLVSTASGHLTLLFAAACWVTGIAVVLRLLRPPA